MSKARVVEVYVAFSVRNDEILTCVLTRQIDDESDEEGYWAAVDGPSTDSKLIDAMSKLG